MCKLNCKIEIQSIYVHTNFLSKPRYSSRALFISSGNAKAVRCPSPSPRQRPSARHDAAPARVGGVGGGGGVARARVLVQVLLGVLDLDDGERVVLARKVAVQLGAGLKRNGKKREGEGY